MPSLRHDAAGVYHPGMGLGIHGVSGLGLLLVACGGQTTDEGSHGSTNRWTCYLFDTNCACGVGVELEPHRTRVESCPQYDCCLSGQRHGGAACVCIEEINPALATCENAARALGYEIVSECPPPET